MVVLPAPEGDERTSIRPRRCIVRAVNLFNVLNLFAQLVDCALQIQPELG